MALRPSVLRPLRAAHGIRALSSSAPRRAGHGDHHQSSSEADTNESFLNSTWRNTFLVLAAGALLYTYLPAPSRTSASPSVSQDAVDASAADDKVPYLTRVLASRMSGAADTHAKYNDKHLELAVEAADQRLLFNEAEQPKVWRMMYPGSFEQASPHCLGVGKQADLSDLKVVSDKQ